MITENMHRGVTVYSGKKGFGKRGESDLDSDILFTVITRLEVGRLRSLVRSVDKDAFIIQHSINDIDGGMVKSRGLH